MAYFISQWQQIDNWKFSYILHQCIKQWCYDDWNTTDVSDVWDRATVIYLYHCHQAAEDNHKSIRQNCQAIWTRNLHLHISSIYQYVHYNELFQLLAINEITSNSPSSGRSVQWIAFCTFVLPNRALSVWGHSFLAISCKTEKCHNTN
jgi:hypothetical protein